MSSQLDPGLQPQRTALSWGRTGLSRTAVALLVLRAGIQEHQPVFLVVGALDMLCAILFFATASWRRSDLALDKIHAASSAWMAGITVLVAITSLAGTWLVLS